MVSANLFNLQVVTPNRHVYSAQVAAVVLPGEIGEFGVLPGHAPLVSTLKIGCVRITPPPGGKVEWLAISGGFAEVKGDEVVVLTPSAERAEEIDASRAEAARQRAEERIAAHAANVNMARAQAALARALNRLAVARQGSAA